MIAENAELKDELKTVKKKLSDTEMQLDVITEQIAEKIEKILSVEKEKVFAVQNMEKMEQEVKEIRESEEILNQQLEKAESRLKSEQSKNDKLTGVTQGLQSLHEKMKVGFQPIESTLSCLSCLEYLAEPNPHTLVCGHSICNKVSYQKSFCIAPYLYQYCNIFLFLFQCFNQHSDPKSQDSLVFCEECKIETKNKQLRESQVMKILTQKFQG